MKIKSRSAGLFPAFMAPSQAPAPMGRMADFHPLNCAMSVGRSVTCGHGDRRDVLSHGAPLGTVKGRLL
ncbi:hypothetical protein [Streptomyces regalis]|uniref:Uncharacterized protein n=1 Tax=Streptomyces regalis TaxID=68262 RepID=A0A101JEI5_9ACTN|nr:hypothetical protein [Streptomyces regalis]KUL25353.1 hypothetical protein ADL12_35080 [Streptomyces regalis]